MGQGPYHRLGVDKCGQVLEVDVYIDLRLMKMEKHMRIEKYPVTRVGPLIGGERLNKTRAAQQLALVHTGYLF